MATPWSRHRISDDAGIRRLRESFRVKATEGAYPAPRLPVCEGVTCDPLRDSHTESITPPKNAI